MLVGCSILNCPWEEGVDTLYCWYLVQSVGSSCSTVTRAQDVELANVYSEVLDLVEHD